MSTVEELDRRVTDLERTVRQLQTRLDIKPGDPDWLEKVSGIITDVEAFDEAMEYARQFRRSAAPDETDA